MYPASGATRVGGVAVDAMLSDDIDDVLVERDDGPVKADAVEATTAKARTQDFENIII